MKTHAIIPIFIPHLGCPNDCVFCNQKKITAKAKPLSGEEMTEMIGRYLKTITGRGILTTEIAFYGGSFTGIPMDLQREYLSVAKQYKDKGLIQKIHLSTRPDYIDESILTNLKDFEVDIIELGVQSFDEEVLRLSNRGHNRKVVYTASRMIQDYGFELGLQLMIGLPGDTYEKSVASAQEAVKIKPSIARLYPTVIIQDTVLYDLYQRGEYTPLSIEEAVRITKEMYLMLTNAGINVIRVGLKSTDHISESGDIAGGYHPAFRQLVEAEIAREQLEAQLQPLLAHTAEIRFYSNGASFSNMIGNRKSNRIYFEKKYPHVRFTFHVDSKLTKDVYLALVL
ncbi:MAG: radical SAM protein [Bacillota bacterium]